MDHYDTILLPIIIRYLTLDKKLFLLSTTVAGFNYREGKQAFALLNRESLCAVCLFSSYNKAEVASLLRLRTFSAATSAILKIIFELHTHAHYTLGKWRLSLFYGGFLYVEASSI